MTVTIKGVVYVAGTGGLGSYKANIGIKRDGKSLLESSRSIEIYFEKEATKFLLDSLKIDSAVDLGKTLAGKSITISIK